LTTAVPSAEYVFGTHSGVLANAEAQKSQIWGNAKGGSLPRIAAFVVAAPLFMDLSGSAVNFQSVIAGSGRLASYSTSIQILPDQLQSGTAKPITGAAAATGKPPPYQNAAPAFIDLNGTGYWSAVSANKQGRLQPQIASGPDTPQWLQSSYFPPSPGNARYPPIRLYSSAPAFMEFGSAVTISAAFNKQGPTIRQVFGSPPWMELTLPSQVSKALVKPPVIVTGPTVAPRPQSFSFPDLSINYSFIFSPSTFSPSTPVIPPLMPNVVCLEYFQAIEILSAAGLNSDEPSFVDVAQGSPCTLSGHVVKQSITSGASVSKGQLVHLTVNKKQSYPAADLNAVIPWYYWQEFNK
jgi:hypothetical protein